MHFIVQNSTVTRLWAEWSGFNPQQEQGMDFFSSSPCPDQL